jgi:hypothetical protein
MVPPPSEHRDQDKNVGNPLVKLAEFFWPLLHFLLLPFFNGSINKEFFAFKINFFHLS